jgi:hypothetical protein
MTDLEFLDAVKVLEKGLGKKPMPADQREIWFRCLSDLPAEAVNRGIIAYLCEGDDWPTVAKIRKLATEQVQGLIEAHSTAFDGVMKAVRRFGTYQKPEGLASLTERERAAVEGTGGWQRFCDCPPDERGTLSAQFRMAWTEAATTEKRLANLPESVRPVSADVKRLAETMSTKNLEVRE